MPLGSQKKKNIILYFCVKKLKTEVLLKIISETCMIIITQGGKKRGELLTNYLRPLSHRKE